MFLLVWVLLFSLIGSVVSLLGGILLLWNEDLCWVLGERLVAFAAGVLLAVSFFDLLPESLEMGKELMSFETKTLLGVTLLGIIFFFFTERFVVWFHGHHHREGEKISSTPLLITLGDSLHNFVDGVTIAGAFLASLPTGIITALSVALHEIPQEIGDFSILLAKGLNRRAVFRLNFFSAFTAVLGATLSFYFLSSLGQYLPLVLAFAAGNFIYIAAADLIPEIHTHEKGVKDALLQALVFFSGVLVIYLVTSIISFG